MHRYSILKIELGKDVSVGKGDSVLVLMLLNVFFGQGWDIPYIII